MGSRMRSASSRAMVDKNAYENRWRSLGRHVIAGIDEAGRGPLAGPVSVAAVILPEGYELSGLDDSKALTDRRRRELYDVLTHDCRVRYSIVFRSSAEIDEMNILRATHSGMREAVTRLGSDVEVALVDGLCVPDFPIEAEFIVKGDALSASIGAASILAKVSRDDYMVALDERYPGYGFRRHKGYGTAAHLAALARLGACPEHRRSFAPVARVLGVEGVQLELGL